MKKELLLTAMITASITTTAFAASNLDISSTTAAPLSMQNSIAYGGDNKIESGIGSPVRNILLGGDKNTVRSSANDSITSGSNNTASGPGSIVAGWYNTNSATHSLVVGTSNNVGGTNNIVGGFGHTNNDNAINSLLVGARNSIDGNNSVALGMNNTVKGNNALVGGTDAKVQGNNAIAFGNGAKATYDDAYAIGRKAEATAQNTVAIGNNAKANNIMGTAIGYNAKAKNDYATAVGYSASGTGNQSSAFGFNSEATAMNTTAVGSYANASGAYSTALGFKTAASNEDSVALGNYSTSAGKSAFAAGTLAKAAEKDSLAIGHSATTTKENGIAIGTNATVDGVDSIAIGKAANIAKAGSIVIGRNTTADELAVSIGTDSVATGWGGTAVGTISKATGAQSTAIGDNAQASDTYSTALGVSSVASGRAANAIGLSKATGFASNAIGFIAEASGKNATAIGNTAKALNENSIAIGTSAKAATDNSIALGAKSVTDTAVSTSSGVIGGSTYSFAGGNAVGTLSIGDSGAERTITNVAAGRVSATSTDAVNGSQLHAIKDVVDNHENRITTIEGDINTLNNRIINGGANSLNEAKAYTDQQVSSVAAASAALAGLHPLDFDKHDRWSYSVGFGNYKNANAAALGAFYRPNKNTMFNAATTVGNGRNTISLGANFKFGKSSEEVTTEDAAQLKKDMKDLSEKYNELAQCIISSSEHDLNYRAETVRRTICSPDLYSHQQLLKARDTYSIMSYNMYKMYFDPTDYFVFGGRQLKTIIRYYAVFNLKANEANLKIEEAMVKYLREMFTSE